MKVCIRLTPVGHYFFGGERGFKGFDKELDRQMSDGYFIKSLRMPSQTTLFGALRYIIGVKDEKLRENAAELIGENSFDVVEENSEFGKIQSISPVYLYNGDEAYIRTPFDHKIATYYKDEEGKEKREVNTIYTPLAIATEMTKTVNYPGKEVEKSFPSDFKAKDGISKSFICLENKKLVQEDDVFKSSVEVVSKKEKGKDNGFAKKEYVRLKKGWSFVFFCDLKTQEIPEHNSSVVLGKDSSVFTVEITEGEEPDVKEFFRNRNADFHYCQSPVYVSGKISEVLDGCSFSIIESETLRRFETKETRLSPKYGADAQLLQLISAGSILYSKDIEAIRDQHAAIAGFNTIIDGGKQ